jgi:hypothetical protein
MKQISLTQGLFALVDDDDYNYLNQFKWYAIKDGRNFYARRNITINEKQKPILMHWDVMNGKGVDHIDNNGLNNQKENLRFCTSSQNQMNTRKRKNTSSIYKGVNLEKRNNKWRSEIRINKKPIYIGTFISEIEAAKAYNKMAIEYFGEFANVNIIENE